MKIFLIRHGITDWNKLGKLQGREDIPLNAEGEKQAECCGISLKKSKISFAVSSPLKRAVKTAEIICKILNIDAPIIDEGFIERDDANLSGTIIKDIFKPREDGSGMEPIETLGDRMINAILKYAENADSDFAVVSHGGSITAVLKTLSNGEIGSGKTRLKNACVCILEYENEKLKISGYNLDPEETEKMITR